MDSPTRPTGGRGSAPQRRTRRLGERAWHTLAAKCHGFPPAIQRTPSFPTAGMHHVTPTAVRKKCRQMTVPCNYDGDDKDSDDAFKPAPKRPP